MNHKSSTVLVVDDSATDLQLTMSAISSNFKVLAAKNGEQALKMMDDITADIILLDVNMPEMDGYETCQRIKKKNNEVEIIFISSNDSTEEIIKSFDLGGSDYIVKPICPEILLNKVKRLLEEKAKNRAMQEEVAAASQIAMNAMSSSGELGISLNFLRNSFRTKTAEELGELMVSCLNAFGIHASFEIRVAGTKYQFSSSDKISPLERELLSRIEMMQTRIIEKGTRFFLNYDAVSLLVKNLPVEDEEKTGRFRDYLAILAEGAADKADFMTHQIEATSVRSESMKAIIKEANDSLAFINNARKEIEEKNVAILDGLISGVEDSFEGLGLTHEEEQAILTLHNNAQEQSNSLFHKNVTLEKELELIIAKFKQFIC